jgi:hypothetical protein
VTLDQVSGFFDAGEAFIEGTIAAVLVVLWVAALALHMARPYMAKTTAKFSLRLGADLCGTSSRSTCSSAASSSSTRTS